MTTDDGARGVRFAILPSPNRWIVIYAPGAFAALLATFAPSKTNATAFVVLVCLCLPTSGTAVPVSLATSALIFKDPSRNDLLIRLWLIVIWSLAIVLQVWLISFAKTMRAKRRL